ncbi:flagellinolysin [Chitinimonas sp.]|uniref:flagellinolysin n=1 Tax=Chitinimonas sp. TaxID=1934313 RepID=UPI002F940131
MQINTNLASLFGQRALDRSTTDMQQVLQRLSSGLRINSARDDAAGLQISEHMRSQIAGNRQAARNTNDGISLLQVAEGGLGSVTDMLQRIRELALQANNATLNKQDRQALQNEASELLSQVTRISRDTQFNGSQVYAQTDVSIGGMDEDRRAVIDGLKLGWLDEAERRIQQYYGIVADKQETLTVVFDPPAGSGLTGGAGGTLAAVGSLTGTADSQGRTLKPFLWIDMADFTPPNLPNGGTSPVYNDRIIAHEMVHAEMGRSMNFAALPAWFKEGTAELIHGADERVLGDGGATAGGRAAIMAAFGSVATSAGYSAAYAAARYMHDKIKQAGGNGIKDIMQYLAANPSADLDVALANASKGLWANTAAFSADFSANGATYISNMNLTNADTGAIGGLDADGGDILTAETVIADIGQKPVDNLLDGFKMDYPTLGGGTGNKTHTFHVGQSADESFSVTTTSVSAVSLGLSSMDLVNLPSFALLHIDQALEFVNKQRGQLGSAMSRLQANINNLNNRADNLSEGKSRIMDADYAEETTRLVRQQVLQQAATLVLNRAASQPGVVLTLLRNAFA